MFDVIVEQIMQLRILVIIVSVFTMLSGIILVLCCRKMGWLRKNVKLIGFFYDMSVRDSISIAIPVIKIGLILSVLVSGARMEMIHIVLFALLVAVGGIIRFDLKEFFMGLIHGVVMIGILFLVNVLSSYLREVIFDVLILIALILLGIFIVLYAVYDLCYTTLSIMQSNQKGK